MPHRPNPPTARVWPSATMPSSAAFASGNTLSLGLPFAAAGSPAAAVASTMVQSSGNCLPASVARVPAAPIGPRGSTPTRCHGSTTHPRSPYPAAMPRIALATAIGSEDPDMPVLLDACAHAGLQAEALAWDDSTVSWARFDAVVLRSTWNYASQRDRFLDWCRRVANCTTLFNPFPVIEWNTDKRYLAELAGDGLPVIACKLVEPAADPL